MSNKMVQITVETLDILAIATKEMKQSRTSEFDLRFKFYDADIVSEKFVKRVVGRTDLDDGMKKLDKLTSEEILMAIPQRLEVTHNIDSVMEVDESVRWVYESVKAVDDRVRFIQDDIQVVDGVVDKNCS